MFYKDKNKTIDKMFEYLKDSFFDNELLLFYDFNDLNLNYNFETKKYLNENFIFQNINKIFLQNKISEIKNILLENNYLLMNETEDWISLNKGYTENGFAEKVFHIHLRYIGNNNELYFRDYLNEYPEIAKEYENLKLNLWKKFKHNRDAYTEAKTEFIIKYTELARKKYKERY